MSEQDGRRATTVQRPSNEDLEAWNAYWKAQGQSWRTEPEIDPERKKFLADRLNKSPDIEKGIYPFKDIEQKLTRADLEWLLAADENGQGQVDWNNWTSRKGLDLRGADLRGLKLTGLPLANMRGGLDWNEKLQKTCKQQKDAAVHLEKAKLRYAHLEGAILRYAYLEEASLSHAHLEGAYMKYAHLRGVNLQGAFLDSATDLKEISLSDEHCVGPHVAGVHWGEVDLSVVDWSQVKLLGDENEARQEKGKVKSKEEKEELVWDYRKAVRAYQQLAVALQSQGQAEAATHFAYRGQVVQRVILRLQRKVGAYIFSWLLALLTGYGSKPERTLYWYAGVIVSFAVIYSILGMIVGFHWAWYEPLLFSFKEFHGRGFFAEQSIPSALQTTAALEAFFGLFIEAGLISAFTQRFFGK